MMDEGMGGICQLPPGFRFQPTDQEIIVCYLKNKIAATATTATTVTSIIADVDIYKFDPWELPEKAVVCGEGEWFFFSPRQRKYPNGCRPNRSAGSGYWKATGTDKPILAGGGSRCIGVKKALVFYQGRSPKGTKTEWVMHEYRLLDADDHIVMRRKDSANSMRLDDWVLCRSRNKGSFVVGLPDDMAPADQSRSSPARTRAEHVEDWIDDQLLQCLINSNEPELDHSMINRKRKNNHLSFQAMPNYSYKRANNGMLNSTTPFRETSFSVSETDELFYHSKYLISTP